MGTRSRRLAFVTCVVVVVIAGFAAVLVFARAGSSETQERDPGLLLVGSRDRLRICIENLIENEALDTEKQKVEEALAGLKGDANWVPAGLARGGEPLVTAGCGAQPFLLSPGVVYENGGFSKLPGFPQVNEPSKFRVMIFVLPDKQIDSMFGDSPIRSAVQEALCDDGQCSTITTGLYLKASEMDAGSLKQSLALAVGLERPQLPSDTSDGTRAAPPLTE